MNYKSVKVRLPNGFVRKAELLTNKTHSGYRTARVSTPEGRINGRITCRHGYDDGRILPFEVHAKDAWKLGDLYLS